MPGPSRSGWVASVACALAGLLACSSSAPPLQSCATPDECPAASRCLSNACVQNAPPSVAVALPPDPQANVLLSFDASASADPDAGDVIVSFGWVFRAVSGVECEAPVVAGAGPVASVRFGCPGRYAVDVTAKDQMGAVSTATKELDVAAYDGAALLTVGNDVSVDHVCTPTPRCTPAGPVTLSATTPGIAPDQVSFAWAVVPPADRPLSSSRRVSLSPDATAAAPSVTIETDGEAISGDWIFHVEARDAAGLIGSADVRVSVLNRPPTVAETIPVPDHGFEGWQFTATGEVPFTVKDDDGDPLLAPIVEWRHAGDGSSTFYGVVRDAPDRVTFSIAVPYSVPADAFHLIGGAGLERTIVFDISDVNGGRTVKSWPIVVGNRRPVLVSTPSGATIPHQYDAASARYAATAQLSTWSDADGDPLVQVPGSSTGDPGCPSFAVVDGVARAECALPFTGTPAMANFAGTHVVNQRVQDPWLEALTPISASFSIGNRAPVITSTALFLVSCTEDAAVCCLWAGQGVCDTFQGTVPDVAFVPARWTDPDGDPVSVQVESTSKYEPVQPLVCDAADCPLEVTLRFGGSVCGPTPIASLGMTISDGAASASGTLPMTTGCN